MFEKWIGQKPGKSSPSVYRFGPAPQSIGRGLFSREGALDARESRERRDKIVPIFRRKKRAGKTQFWPENFHFLSRIACCSQESTSAWNNFRQKQPKNDENDFLGLRFFFSKVGVRIMFSLPTGEFKFFWPRKNLPFLGGGITSKLASQWPSLGIYKHAPPVFWRKRRLLNWKKGGQVEVMMASWGGQLVPKSENILLPSTRKKLSSSLYSSAKKMSRCLDFLQFAQVPKTHAL